MNTRDLVIEADDMVNDFTTDRVFTDWNDADTFTKLGDKLEALINEARAETWDAAVHACVLKMAERVEVGNPWRADSL